HLADEGQLAVLTTLHAELEPKLRGSIAPTTSARALRRALTELNESIERFNRRWHGHLNAVDLTRINELRDGYNRYYLLEKDGAVRSVRVAHQGFFRLEPLTAEKLTSLMPPLPMPRLKE